MGRFLRMHLFIRSISAAIVACWVAPAVGLGTTTISSLPIGLGNLATRSDIGQSFLTPKNDVGLSSFTGYFFGAGQTVNYDVSIYPFNPITSRTVGPALYISPEMSVGSSSFPPFPAQTFSFPTPLALLPNADYLLVLGQSEFINGSNLQVSVTDNYTDGALYDTPSTAPYSSALWTRDPFDSSGSLGFSATFVSVPEPAMASTAFVAVAILGRPRRILRWRRGGRSMA